MHKCSEIVSAQKKFFLTNRTKNIDFRLKSLSDLRMVIEKHEQGLIKALYSDLHKGEFEAYTTEIGIMLAEIRYVMKYLRKWAKTKRVRTPLTHLGSKSLLYKEPYGVSLIISPWNYPFQLAVAPLIGAIAAGNCAVIKPSELTPATSALLSRMLKETFPEEYIAVVEGDAKTSQALLQQPFDYIFFTGSVNVGKIVMEAASKHLTPVTLELGGKSPCIVHEDANMGLAAKRIAWGKFTNAGQTCIAPDYVYVHKNCKEQFLQELNKAIMELYGPSPLVNPDYTHLISKPHFERLISFLPDGNISTGGQHDTSSLSISPTVLTGITWDAPIMQEEIFGPILPVLEYKESREVIDKVRSQQKPLSLYLFTSNKKLEEEILQTVSFGGGCINDTIYHFTSPHLPFGGVGHSGMGSYHGKSSFDTFSHQKSVLKQTTKFDIPFRYPNTKGALKKIKMFLK